MSNSIVLFTGTMTDSVRNTIEEYGPERLSPGDVIVANDPYRTGTHVNDMLFVRPVFHDGEILAFANLKAHQLDMGGAVPRVLAARSARSTRTASSCPRARCSAPASPCARPGA